MKKIICIVFVFLLFFSGCSADGNEKISVYESLTVIYDYISFEMLEDPVIISESEHFTVWKTASENTEEQLFWYRIYNKNGDVFFEGGTEWKEPMLHETNGIVALALSLGTSDTRWQFFDSETGEISKVFADVLADKAEMICCYSSAEKKLLIFSAFDDSQIIGEISADFSSKVFPVYEAEFLSDSEIKFSYYDKDDQEKTTVANFGN